MSGSGVRVRLERIFRAGVAAADPAAALRRAVLRRDDGELMVAGESLPPEARVFALAMGKAAVPMARALVEVAGDRVVAGLAIAPEGQGAGLPRFSVLEAAHPVPDERCERAGREALAFVAAVPAADVLVVLLSGGTSSLTTCPAEGLCMADLAATTQLLLASGAPIDELNAVRRHLSAVSGGRLAAAAGSSRIHVLVVSDVAGDRIEVIGSGPFAADPGRPKGALDVLERFGVLLEVPPPVRTLLEGSGPLEASGHGGRAERREVVRHVLLANNRTALEGAREAARREGLVPVVVDEELEGEAREAGARLVLLAASGRHDRPTCLLAGGETTVTVRGNGRGGRSQELALAAAIALEGKDRIALLAGGSDGADGPTDAAGAFADAGTLPRARALGLDAQAALEANDAYGFFDREGGLLRTGPTGTNVRDLVLIEAG